MDARAAAGEAARRAITRTARYAGGSALTDGQRLYAWFGSRGLYAVDFTGKVLWEKSLGQMQTRNGFGEGSSVAIHDGTLVVPWDHEGADFVIGLDAATGKEKWRTPRDEPTTWSTPLDRRPRRQAAGGAARAPTRWSATTWRPARSSGRPAARRVNAIPSPVFGDGLLIAMGGFRGSMARAIRIADAKGNVDGHAGPGLDLHEGHALRAVAAAVSRRRLLPEGQLRHPHQPRRARPARCASPSGSPTTPNVYASPVGADGRVYVVGREGKTAVLEAGPTLKVLATNVLDDATDTSPALVDGELYLRGAKNLYRISAN